MLKLLQEVHGHANFPGRAPQGRPPGVMLLPTRCFAGRPPKVHKKTLTVVMQDLPDIPNPVAIRYMQSGTLSSPSKL